MLLIYGKMCLLFFKIKKYCRATDRKKMFLPLFWKLVGKTRPGYWLSGSKAPRKHITRLQFFILFSQHFMQNSKIQTIETSKWI